MKRSELRALPLGHQPDGEFHRVPLQGADHVKMLKDFLLGQPFYASAPAGKQLQQPFGSEQLNGLADRRA